jgi:hypothetical protein
MTLTASFFRDVKVPVHLNPFGFDAVYFIPRYFPLIIIEYTLPSWRDWRDTCGEEATTPGEEAFFVCRCVKTIVATPPSITDDARNETPRSRISLIQYHDINILPNSTDYEQQQE